MDYCCGRKTTRRALVVQLLLAAGVWFWSSRDRKGGVEVCRGRATAIVVGGVLLPHGDFALDPTFFANGTLEREVANDVARGARHVGLWLVERQHHRTLVPTNTAGEKNNTTKDQTRNSTDDEPLIVLMTTPHGIKLDYEYGIYISSKGSGTATIGGDCTGFRDTSGYSGRRGKITKRFLNGQWTERKQQGRHHCQHKSYNVTLEHIDLAPTSLAQDLLTNLRRDKNHPVSGVYSYNDEAPIPLNWGEIVPLLLLPTNFAQKRILPLIWTFPYRRYNHSVEMVPELLRVGADIMQWARQRPEKIAILVSGDLSHTHQASGPYGYSAASALYDEAIGRWAGGNINTNSNSEKFLRSWNPCRPEAANALLNRARELQPDAKSCGFTGYVMWHGMMCSSSPSSILTKDSPATTTPKFDSRVFVDRNVSYYGMIGAIFEPYLASDDGRNRVDKNIDYNVRNEDK